MLKIRPDSLPLALLSIVEVRHCDWLIRNTFADEEPHLTAESDAIGQVDSILHHNEFFDIAIVLSRRIHPVGSENALLVLT